MPNSGRGDISYDHDFAIEEIQYGRQVQLSAAHVELGHVRHPLFTRSIGIKLSRQIVRGNMSELPFVGSILFHGSVRISVFKAGEVITRKAERIDLRKG